MRRPYTVVREEQYTEYGLLKGFYGKDKKF
jgi:hypothetical protein